MKTIFSYHVLLFCILLPFIGSGQFILVTGSILDGKTDTPLGNVNIFEPISGIGTITNISGCFSLMLKPGNAEIIISHEGFKEYSQKMVVKSDTVLTVSLVPVTNLKTKTKDTEHQKTAEKLDKGKL